LFQDYYSLEGNTDVETWNRLKNQPSDMYNTMNWKYHENTADGCDLSSMGLIRLPSFISCVITRYADKNVEVWHFREDGEKKLEIIDFWDLHEPAVEEYPKRSSLLFHLPGYQHPCEGDVGGGHWMKGGKEGTRDVLIGIQVTSSAPCGWNSRILKLNNLEFLNWIKLHSCVDDEPTCKCWPVCGIL